MRRIAAFSIIALVIMATIGALDAEARGRTGSTRVGGYTSSGKGSHYVGGR